MKNSCLRNAKKDAGYSILEQALILPFVIFFIIGVIDINSTFQAYTGMQDGVAEALRCLTPTDGACTIDNSKLSARYPVTRAKATLGWSIPQYKFDGALSLAYLEAPKLADSTYYVSLENTPKINIGSTQEEALNPTFTDAAGNKYHPLFNRDSKKSHLSRLSGTVKNGATVLGVVKLGKIPTLDDAPCYEKLQEVDGVFLPNGSKRCSDKVKLVLHVNGSAGGTTKNTKGAVLLYYAAGSACPAKPQVLPSDLKNISGWTSLGGREFVGSSDGSLYTRGSAKENINGDSTLKEGILEYNESYNKELKAKRGESVCLLFVLEHRGFIGERTTAGHVSWKANQIRLFSEKVVKQSLCNIRCQEKEGARCTATINGAALPEESITKTTIPDALKACSLLEDNSCSGTATVAQLPKNAFAVKDKIFVTAEGIDNNTSSLSCLTEHKSSQVKVSDLIKDKTEKKGSLFFGKHDPICNWESKVKRESAKALQPFFEISEDLITPTKTQVGKRTSTTNPQLACYNAEPSNIATTPYEGIAGSPFLWSEIPTYCFNSSEWICDIGAPIFNGALSGVSHDLNIAEAKARNAINAALPWVHWDCKQDSCATVEATSNGDKFTVTTSVKVPLKIFSMIGLAKHAPTITYSDSANWEGRFVR